MKEKARSKGKKPDKVHIQLQMNCDFLFFFWQFTMYLFYYRSLQCMLILYRSIRFNIVISIMEIRVIAINIFLKNPFPVLSLFLYSCTRINLGGAWFQNNKQIRLNDKSSAFSTDFSPASRAKSKSPIGKHFGEKQVCIFLSLKHDYCKHCFPTIQNQILCSIKKYVQAENLQAFRRQNSNKNESNKHAITLIICSNAKADCNIIGFWLGIICWSILL